MAVLLTRIRPEVNVRGVLNPVYRLHFCVVSGHPIARVQQMISLQVVEYSEFTRTFWLENCLMSSFLNFFCISV